MSEEEEVHKNTELRNGFDNEIYTALLERLRYSPIFSPQRVFTGSCADQVLSPPVDLFAFEREWASIPMYLPQRSPTGRCADQEQSPEDKMHLIILSLRRCRIYGIVSVQMSAEDMMHLNSLEIGNSKIYGDVSFQIDLTQRSPTRWCAEQEQSPEDKMHSNSLKIRRSTIYGIVSVQMSAEDMMHLNSLEIGNSKIHGIVSVQMSTKDKMHSTSLKIGRSTIYGIVSVQMSAEDMMHLNSLEIGNSKIHGNVSFQIDSTQRSPTSWCAEQEQSPEDKMHLNSLKIWRSTIFGGVSMGNTFVTGWNGDGCSLVEPKLLNNSVHQNSPGSQPPEVVRPLQQRNDGVVIRDDNDEQNVNLIPINEVRPLEQRNDGVVIRDNNNEQNVNLISSNEVQHLQDINIGVVCGNELDQNVIHIHEETERIEAMARKRKATYVGEGNERIEAMARKQKATYVGEGNENSKVRPLQQRNDGVVIRDDTDEENVNLIPIKEVQPLREINIGVVFGNEPDQNVIPIHEETGTIQAMARKQKATYVGEGNENSQVQPLQQRNDGVVIRDDTNEQNVNLNPINEVQPLREINIGVVFGNELDQNVIPIHEGYSLEEGRNVEVNSLMDKKLYSGVQDIQLFQPSWPEVEIMQEDSSEQQILGELGPKNIEHKAVQKKEKGRSKKNIGHKVASAEKSCKKKNTTETPTKKYWTKRFISLEDLLQHVGRKRADAAKALGVSVPTFKRCCRKYGITCWNGDGCPRIEPELLNNSVHQSSPGSIPAEIRGEKETSALLRAKQDDVTIKANYGESVLKFQLSSESGVTELNKEVAKRSLLELGSFNVEYLDEDEERILIACDEDFQACVEFFSRSSSNQVIRLLVKNKVSNSEKSHQSCSELKTKSS